MDALVLFNRYYQLDIDIEKMELVAGNPYSSSDEIHESLRWISLLSGKVDCNLAATTGIHTGPDAIKTASGRRGCGSTLFDPLSERPGSDQNR